MSELLAEMTGGTIGFTKGVGIGRIGDGVTSVPEEKHDPILREPSVVISEFVKRMSEVNDAATRTKILQTLAEATYEASMQIARNMGVSEEEREAAERRAERLEAYLRKQDELKDDFEAACQAFENIIVDPLDRAMLEKLIAREAPTLA